MSTLSTMLTGFHEFVDIRQDQLRVILTARRSFDDILEGDGCINDFVATCDNLGSLPDLTNVYHRLSNNMQQNNNQLSSRLRSINLRPFRAIMGDNDYV